MKKTLHRAGSAIALATLVLLAACGGGGTTSTPDDGDSAPIAPQFVAHGSSAHTVSLGWTGVAGANGYTVERRLAGGAWALVATFGSETSRYLDTGLDPRTAYVYRLVATGTAQPAVAEKTATTIDEAALQTAAGAALGAAQAHSVGPGGARIAFEGAQAVVDVPTGALAADAEVRLQAITNTAPDGIDPGLHLQVQGPLAKPLTLTLAYPEAMAPHADGLGVATRSADGSWVSLPLAAIDRTARTVTLQLDAGATAGAAGKQAAKAGAATNVSLDFYVVRYLDFYLSPREASVKTGQTRRLVPYAHTRGVIGRLCIPDEELGCLPMPLMGTQEIPFENSKAGYTRKWYVFAEEGGDAVSGTVTPTGSLGATYKAPADVPEPNPVVVSFVSVHAKSGRSLTLSSKITVTAPVWTGTIHGTLSVPGGTLGFVLTAEAVWTPVPGSNGTRFVANGTQSLGTIDMGCSGVVSPATVALPPGALTVDRSVEPARYTLDIGSVWRSSVTGSCPGQGSTTVAFDVPARLIVEGTVSGDGTLITGQTVQNTIAWDWAFSSEL
jgi:hypothetical protein